MNDKNRQPCSARRRGSTYVSVLGVAMAVTAIGLGSVAVSRIQTRSTTQANQWAEARMLAFSASEHAMTQINNTDSWRANLNGVTVARSLGSGSFTWRVIDPGDGDLADNNSDPATLIATGTVGDAVYSLTVKLSTPGQSQGTAGVNTVLWGVNEDDGMLFSIADYTQSSMDVTKYGLLYWNDGGTHERIRDNVEGFTIDADGVAYMVSGRNIGSYSDPVLMRFSVNTASTTADNVVEIIGSINWSDGDICGLALDPTDGRLYALGQKGGSGTADRLLLINKLTAQVTSDVGAMEGLGEQVGQGEGMTFDGSGVLYVTDESEDYILKIDKTTGAITQIVDNDAVNSSKFQALAWDAVNNRLIAAHENTKKLYHVTLQNGNNSAYGSLAPYGLNDVEAMGFVPPGASTTTVKVLQLPNSINRLLN